MNLPTCKKCGSARVQVNGDELHCPLCGWYGFAQSHAAPVPREMKRDPRFQNAGYAHTHRPCQICGRTIKKPTKYAELCVKCMYQLHSWLKNKSHLKPPPYVRMPDGRLIRNPFRTLHTTIANTISFERIEQMLLALSRLLQASDPLTSEVVKRTLEPAVFPDQQAYQEKS